MQVHKILASASILLAGLGLPAPAPALTATPTPSGPCAVAPSVPLPYNGTGQPGDILITASGSGHILRFDVGSGTYSILATSGIATVIDGILPDFNDPSHFKVIVEGFGAVQDFDAHGNTLGVYGVAASGGGVEQGSFAPDGALWVARRNPDKLVKFPAGGGTGVDIVLSGVTLNAPDQAAFDLAGNMLITDTLNNRVLRVAAADVNLPSPPATVFASSTGATGLAFDGDHTFYLLNQIGGTSNVAKLDAVTGVVTPWVSDFGSLGVNSANGGILYQGHSVTLDEAGNVWIIQFYPLGLGNTDRGLLKISPAGVPLAYYPYPAVISGQTVDFNTWGIESIMAIGAGQPRNCLATAVATATATTPTQTPSAGPSAPATPTITASSTRTASRTATLAPTPGGCRAITGALLTYRVDDDAAITVNGHALAGCPDKALSCWLGTRSETVPVAWLNEGASNSLSFTAHNVGGAQGAAWKLVIGYDDGSSLTVDSSLTGAFGGGISSPQGTLYNMSQSCVAANFWDYSADLPWLSLVACGAAPVGDAVFLQGFTLPAAACTATATLTMSPTAAGSASSTPSHTATLSPTATPTMAVTGTSTLTPSQSASPAIPFGTLMATATPTLTASPTASPVAALPTFSPYPSPLQTVGPGDPPVYCPRQAPGGGPQRVVVRSAFGGRCGIRIYRPEGRLCRRLWEGDLLRGQSRILFWGIDDEAGQHVSSGIYLVVFQDSDGTRHTAKVAIIR